MDDYKYLEQTIKFCKLLPGLYSSDIAVTVTDLEKHLLMQQAKSFKLNSDVNEPIRKGGGIEKAIKTKQPIVARIPQELYGISIITRTVPLFNEKTGSIIGVISIAISQEKESSIMEMVSELHDSSKSMENSSHALFESSEKLSRKSNDMNANIDAVTDEINKMDNIIGYIKSVSETSNLLGLNASIEAARAGDAGRGFAVVAEEMRKLAINSKESSVEILTSLHDLKNNINALISGIQEFSEVSVSQSEQTEHISDESKHLSVLSKKLADFSKKLL